MRRAGLLPRLLVLLVLAPAIARQPVLAGETADGPGRRLLSAADAVPFRGVGRVNIAGARFCTGTLITPNEVLTAAHCLFHPQTGAAVPPEAIRFVAGLRIDTTAAVRQVVRTVPHPGFAFGAAGPEGVATDVALLVLAAPVTAEAASPIRPGPLGAAPVAIVSYARDRPQAPSIEAPCSVVARFGDALALDCAITYGVSGAPVLQGAGPEVRVVGVISAMGQALGGPAGRDVALAAQVEPTLAVLRERRDTP